MHNLDTGKNSEDRSTSLSDSEIHLVLRMIATTLPARTILDTSLHFQVHQTAISARLALPPRYFCRSRTKLRYIYCRCVDYFNSILTLPKGITWGHFLPFSSLLSTHATHSCPLNVSVCKVLVSSRGAAAATPGKSRPTALVTRKEATWHGCFVVHFDNFEIILS